MKKFIKYLSIAFVAVFLICSFCVVGCDAKITGEQTVGQYKAHKHVESKNKENSPFGYFREEYKSVYTEEEHIQRITEQYNESTLLDVGVGRIDVFLMYSFQGNAEYFIIQHYHWQYDTPTSYYIGHIENDEYYLISGFDDVFFYERNKAGIWEEGNKINVGENPYSRAEVLDKKKYYGCMGIFAWEADREGMLLPHRERIFQYRVDEDRMVIIYNEIVEMSDENLENYKNCTYVRGTKTSLNSYKK